MSANSGKGAKGKSTDVEADESAEKNGAKPSSAARTSSEDTVVDLAAKKPESAPEPEAAADPEPGPVTEPEPAKASEAAGAQRPPKEPDPVEDIGEVTAIDPLHQDKPLVSPRRPAGLEISRGPAYGGPAGPPPGPPPPNSSYGPTYGRADTATLDPPRAEPRLPEVAKVSGAKKSPRKAHLQVARFEPWSVMKFSFVMSLVCFLVLFVAVAVLYMILSTLGVFDALANTIRDLTSNDQGKSGGIDPASWFSAARILGYTALIGTLNVLLITALSTIWSVIYNMAADLVGGVEVTLKESEQ